MVTLFPRRQTYNPAKPLAVLHIPKTAGSSLIEAIVQTLQPETVISGFDQSLFGTFTNFETLAPELQRVIFRPPNQPPAARLLAGHMALSTLRQADPSRQVITVLREPTARLLSHWLFWRGHTDERLAPWGAWANQVRLARQTLESFLAAPSLACQHDNLCLRMLLWPHPQIPNHTFIDPRHDKPLLAQARRALRSLHFTDLVENPALAANTSRYLGQQITLPRSNETSRMPEHLRGPLDAQLTPPAFAALDKLTRLDRQLWHDVCRIQMPHEENFREHVLLRNIARFAELMAQ